MYNLLNEQSIHLSNKKIENVQFFKINLENEILQKQLHSFTKILDLKMKNIDCTSLARSLDLIRAIASGETFYVDLKTDNLEDRFVKFDSKIHNNKNYALYDEKQLIHFKKAEKRMRKLTSQEEIYDPIDALGSPHYRVENLDQANIATLARKYVEAYKMDPTHRVEVAAMEGLAKQLERGVSQKI